MRRVLTATHTLIWLAVVLSLLALLAAHQIGCEGECSRVRATVGALVLPLAVGWPVVMAVPLGRLWRRWTAAGPPKRRR